MSIFGQNSLLNQYVPTFQIKDLYDGQILTYDNVKKAFINKDASGNYSFIGLSDTAAPALNDGYVKWNSIGTELVYSATIPADDITGLAEVALTGDYNDLLNTLGETLSSVNDDYFQSTTTVYDVGTGETNSPIILPWTTCVVDIIIVARDADTYHYAAKSTVLISRNAENTDAVLLDLPSLEILIDTFPGGLQPAITIGASNQILLRFFGNTELTFNSCTMVITQVTSSEPG